jgi:hypothetical protein
MDTLSCSDYSRKMGEDMIGSAPNYQTYILVECPQPWLSETLESKWVPDNLRFLVKELKLSHRSIQLLLIANDESHHKNYTTLLIYQQKDGLSRGYTRRELKLPSIEKAAFVIKQYLSGINPDHEVKNPDFNRDILVCTHGNHDKCCARYGNPFYFYAKNIIANLQLDNTQIWKSTHFGGHRFAPTAIDFPQGRYYGGLNLDSFPAILTLRGDIQSLNQIYRGWGILPSALQVLERQLMLHHGWDWFTYSVSGKILEQSLDNNIILAELSFVQSSGTLYTYQAQLIRDQVKTQVIKSSCNSTQELIIVKYFVANLSLVGKKVLAHIT